MDDPKSRFVEATNRPGGWPRVSAQFLAAVLHLALLGLVVSTWRAIPQSPSERPVKVALVPAPPPKPVVAPPKSRLIPPSPSLAAPSEPRAGTPAPLAAVAAGGPKPDSAPPPTSSAKARGQSRPNPPPPRAKPLKAERPPPQQEKPGRPAVTAHVEPDVAIYSVTIEKAGAIGAISLLQSSGRPEFDAAGEQMIRRSIMFHPPPGPDDRTRYFSVTIRFTPKPP